jgi:hypothetical protein
LPIPVQGEPLPRRGWIRQDLFERGEALTDHPVMTDRVRAACQWGFMQGRIQRKGSDEGHLLFLILQAPFQDAGGGLA